jgi:hypothetical protein
MTKALKKSPTVVDYASVVGEKKKINHVKLVK